MIVTHVAPEGWADTEEVGVIQPSHVAGIVHSVQLEEGDLVPGPQGPQGPQGQQGQQGQQGTAGLDGATGAQMYAGAMAFYAMSAIPAGWLECNGAAVSRLAYAALFNAISTLYGAGDGSTTFNLPDMRGYFPRAAGTNADGTASDALGVKSADGIKSHTHEFNVASTTGSVGLFNGRVSAAQEGSGSFTTNGGAGIVISNASGIGETRPKSIALTMCICTGIGSAVISTASGNMALVEVEKATITGGSWNMVAHGLGRAPLWFDVFARCKIANNGYSVGDVLKPLEEIVSNTGQPMESMWADSVNIALHISEGFNLVANRKDTRAAFAITAPNWALLFRMF